MDSIDKKQIDAVVLVDNETNYRTILDAITSIDRSLAPRQAGSGMAQGCQFIFHGNRIELLSIADEPGHPFALLAIEQLALRGSIASVLAVSTAHSLVDYIMPGDLAIVTKASALPYPALYENKDPYAATSDSIESYRVDSDSLNTFHDFLHKNQKSITWQQNIPEVHSGYAKHPTWGGSQLPWAADQFAQLLAQGIETYSEMSVAVYEAQKAMPATSLISVNQIRTNLSSESPEYWSRHEGKLMIPLVNLVTKWIQRQTQPTTSPLDQHL